MRCVKVLSAFLFTSDITVTCQGRSVNTDTCLPRRCLTRALRQTVQVSPQRAIQIAKALLCFQANGSRRLPSCDTYARWLPC